MTDRNELERLLSAATEGPWAVRTIDGSIGGIDTACGEFSVAQASIVDRRQVGIRTTADALSRRHANAALICFLRNNAQHYLSLMDEVERLKTENEAAGRNVAQLQRDGVKFCEALRKCSDLVRRYNGRQSEKLDDIPAIVSQALGETHDN